MTFMSNPTFEVHQGRPIHELAPPGTALASAVQPGAQRGAGGVAAEEVERQGAGQRGEGRQRQGRGRQRPLPRAAAQPKGDGDPGQRHEELPREAELPRRRRRDALRHLGRVLKPCPTHMLWASSAVSGPNLDEVGHNLQTTADIDTLAARFRKPGGEASSWKGWAALCGHKVLQPATLRKHDAQTDPRHRNV